MKFHPDYPGHLVEEIAQLLTWDENQSVPQRLEEQATQTPDLVALKKGQQSLTYLELHQAAKRTAAAILDLLTSKHRVVALLFEHDLQSIIAMMGVLAAGKIYVPLDPSFPIPQIQFALRDSEAELLLTSRNLLPLAGQFGHAHLKVADLKSILDKEDQSVPYPELIPDSPAAIYYTSGSTGQPKGVLVSHRSLLFRGNACLPGDRMSHLFSYAYSASTGSICTGMLHGVGIYLYDLNECGIGKFSNWLLEEKITLLYPPSSLFREFLHSLSQDQFFPDLRQVNLSGEPLYKKDLHPLWKHVPYECVVRFSLASTEASVISQRYITRDIQFKHSSQLMVGYPVFGKKIHILNEQRNPIGKEQIGEIAVQSNLIALGYWKQEELTSTTFPPAFDRSQERMFLTGDLGILHQDGMLELKGRKDSMVKIRGYRVELPAVESALRNLYLVREVAVIVTELRPGKSVLTAFIVPEQDPPPKSEALRAILEKEFPTYMIPSRFIYVEQLPRTSTNKVDYRALTKLSDQPTERTQAYLAPRNTLERQLCLIWSEVLEVDPIGVNDNFFDIGGTSLQAMTLFVQIERLVGKELPLSLLLKARTPAEQAHILRREEWTPDWSSLVPVQTKGSKPPLFCLPGVGGNVLTFHDLSRHLGPEQPVYALQSRGLGGSQKPLSSMYEIASFHIMEMKTIQPNGPYYLCGSSFGGMAAYEIAQQLHDQGDSIAFVGLFDTYGPDYPKKLPGMTRTRMRLNNFVTDVEKHWEIIQTSDWKTRSEYLRSRLPSILHRVRRNLTNRWQEIRNPLPKKLRDVRKANKKAAKYEYLQPKFGGRLIIFRASKQPFGIIPDPTIGWSRIAGDRIEVVDVTGNHDTLLWEPRVGEVTKVFDKYLIETQALFSASIEVDC